MMFVNELGASKISSVSTTDDRVGLKRIDLERRKGKQLDQAMSAYDAGTLVFRFAGFGGVEHLSFERAEAVVQINRLLSRGYELVEHVPGAYHFSQGLMGGGSLDELVKKLDMKPAGQRSVFITYQWAQKDIARALHQAFEAKGFLVIRDESNLSHGVYLPGFMKIIGHPHLNYVLPVISKSYLESKNCMYEVNQVMKRYDWEKTLLPYVVNSPKEADAHIYSGIGGYLEHWQREQAQEIDPEKREVIENIQRNIQPFTRTITTRINIPESELIATQYEALFTMLSGIEAEQEHGKFKEIEELLRIASTAEKMEEPEEVKEAFDKAILKLKGMKHLDGIDVMFAKVYGLYGEYLLRQENKRDGEKFLKIATNFGYLRISDPAVAASAPPVVAQSNILLFTPIKTPSPPKARPSVNPQELSQFLRLVAEGEQQQVEAMLQKNRDLVLFPGNVADLSQRTFENITGFQLAVWNLDWHMWTMMRRYLPDEAAATQLSVTGSWVNQYGLHAGVPGGPLDKLAIALKTYIDTGYKNEVWQKQVGGAQLWLPVHVINEYCRPDRSFHPCPSFIESTLPRTREIDAGEWFTAAENGGRLGSKFAICRGVGRSAAGGAVPCWLGVIVDHAAVCQFQWFRTQQLTQLFSELSVSTGHVAQQRARK